MTSLTMLVQRLDTAELPAIQPLFESVFKLPASLSLLQWKYANGRGESWVVRSSDEPSPIMHCGLCFRHVLLAGTPVRAAQLVDLMAAPKRNGLSRQQSPFTILMQQILDNLPRSDNPDAIAFGFPSDRAMRLGEHAGVYRAVDQWCALEFGGVSRFSGPRVRPWRPDLPSELALADRFWQDMARDLASFTLGVRDSHYLIQRYLNHPEKKYRLWVVESRWRRHPVGLAVVGPGDGQFEIVDVLGRWDDIPEIILALQRWLNDTNGHSLTLMLTARFARQLAPFAVQCADTQFRIMANPRTPAPSLMQLQGRWWLTGGDTDYR